MTDSTGAVVWSAQYDPFGEAIIAPTSTITNNLRFPGQYFNQETGGCYNWNRDYNQHLGRYIESDPIGIEGDINLYLYTADNPIRYFDQSGLFTSGHHRNMTTIALSLGGCENLSSVPRLTAGIDWEDHSSWPENAYWHAMSDGIRNESREAAMRKASNHIEENLHKCTRKGLAFALHAEQDKHTSSHAFKPWYGGIPGPRHFYHDAFGRSIGTGQQNIWEATMASIELIRKFKSLCPGVCQCQK